MLHSCIAAAGFEGVLHSYGLWRTSILHRARVLQEWLSSQMTHLSLLSWHCMQLIKRPAMLAYTAASSACFWVVHAYTWPLHAMNKKDPVRSPNLSTRTSLPSCRRSVTLFICIWVSCKSNLNPIPGITLIGNGAMKAAASEGGMTV